MLTQKEYKKYPESYWKGKKVRILSEMQTNGGKIFPIGTLMKIVRKYKGFELKIIEICPHCKRGDNWRISRVQPYSLSLVDSHNSRGK